MYYGAIKALDIANGPGVRVSLFVSGCRNRCEGCFQPETWSFEYGKKFDKAAMAELITMLGDPHVKGLSILGGDPMEPENVITVSAICRSVRELFPEKTIWVWTGYTFEYLMSLPSTPKMIFPYIDVLVDGPFVKELKDLNLFYRGSSNQRVIDVKKSLEAGCAVRWEGDQEWR